MRWFELLVALAVGSVWTLITVVGTFAVAFVARRAGQLR